MKTKLSILCLLLTLGCLSAPAQTPPPLRIFIRAGAKTHGPDQHDHPRFLKEWTELLNQRGAKADGAMVFPTGEQLAATDVLVLFAPDAADIKGADRENFEAFLKRGGGLVVIHDAICGHDPDWFKTVAGGAWNYSHAGFFEGDLSFYYQDHNHPITKDASNFEFDDEMYYHLDMMPGVHVLAATYQPDARNRQGDRIFPSVYDIVPQMWTYEKDNYRAFVCIPGHNYKTFNLPHFRAVLLRGMAWAGKRDADLLVSKDELATLTYPEGGPTAPEKAGAKIVVPPEFNLNLVAAEPLIDKAISLDWDAKGRLWIAETPEYPFHQDPTRPLRDRISILDQPDASGRMQRKSVFYEGLHLVTSLVLYKDGVIVSQAPDIYWLRDTKGTGKADTKVVLYTGFGTNDTHAVISNLRWGMDGWVYATVGYSRGDIYSGDRTKHFGPVSDGVIRFKPDGSAMEEFCAKSSNTWGVDTAPDGEFFFSQANGNHIDHVVMPEWALARGRVNRAAGFQNIEDHTRSFPMMSWKQQAYKQIDWVGNFTAAAGACIYDGGAWPAKYDYTYYVTEPTINIVHQDVLRPKGVTYVASRDAEFEGKEFVGSTDLWFRPIHARVGPDGAMYIVDFYNQAAVHNDTRGPRHDPHSNAAIRPDRDHYFGRIWRIQHKEARTLTIPDLWSASAGELVRALEHPNMWVRMTAERLLVEGHQVNAAAALEALAQSGTASAFGRVHALWTLDLLGLIGREQDQAILTGAINSGDPVVSKNALEIAATAENAGRPANAPVRRAALERVRDANPRVRLEALIALGSFPADPEVARAVVAAYPALNDSWSQSAVLGVATRAPLEFLEAALDAQAPEGLRGLAAELGKQIGEKGDADAAARTVVAIAARPASADALKQAALESLGRSLGSATAAPSWSPELQKAFHELLASANADLGTAALPILARWDKAGMMAGEVKPLVEKLSGRLNDSGLSDERRAQLAASMLAVRQTNPEVFPLVTGLLGSVNSPALQRRVIEALGALPEPRVGGALVSAFPALPAELRDFALNEVFKRAEWTTQLLDAIKSGRVSLAGLGPVVISRLRNHSDPAVAKRANEIIDELRGPEMKQKDALIAQFTPLVTQPGDAANGKKLFTQNCAICHKFNGEGKDIAPDLSGMGVHGPADLIIHILDPNREVEPNYYAYSIQTKDGETYDGVISRENRTSVILRNSAGDKEINVRDIASRRNTGLSLMPNGFEALGGPALRDILAYICAGESRFRTIDMRGAFTSTTSRGLFLDPDKTDDTLAFRRFGIVKVEGIPFEVVHPLKTASARNVVVLKGGLGYAKTMPQRVEIKNVGVAATRLHFLGGVGGWAYPYGKDAGRDLPVAKVTVHFAGNQSEEFVLKNGLEFADHVAVNEVPGSKLAPGLVSHGQVRWFTKPLKHHEVIQSITLESFDNTVAPVFVAITADMEGAPAASSAAGGSPGPR